MDKNAFADSIPRSSGIFASMAPKLPGVQWGSAKMTSAAQTVAPALAYTVATKAWSVIRKDMLAIIFAVVCIAVLVIFLWSVAQKQSFEDQMRVLAKDYRKELETRARRIVEPDIEAQDLKELAELYVKGIPDQYDRGKLVPGVQPNHEAAIRLLNEAIKMEYDVPGYEPIDTIIDLANLLYTSETNKDVELSRSLYLYVRQYGDTVQRAIADDRLDQIAQYVQSERINERRGTAQRDHDELAAANRPVQIQVLLPPRDQLGDHVAAQARELRPRPAGGAWGAAAPVRNAAPAIRNDPQNVHDSTILRSLSSTLNKLGSGEGVSQPDIERAIVNSNLSNNRKANAMRALGTIFRTQAHVSGINATEIDALSAVWAQVRGNRDREEALITELSEMVEHGAVVCATGRAARIVDTMNIVNPERVEARPKWAVAREILDKSSVLFNRHVERLSPNERRIFEADTAGPTELAEYRKIAAKIEDGMRNDLREEYVRPGILTETDLGAEVGKWMPDLFIEPTTPAPATAAADPPAPTATPAVRAVDSLPIVAVATPATNLPVATPAPVAHADPPATTSLPVATPVDNPK